MSLNLAGEWKLSDAQKSISIKCNLPGDNYSALLKAGKIEDPFYRKNEADIQWVADKDWIFERSFQVTDKLLASKQILLHLSEIDTIAKIFINKHLISSTENMFIPLDVDVKSFLKNGLNQISIYITSPVKEAVKLAKEQPLFIPWTKNNTAPFMNLIRKVQCHAGWDWGISLIPSGVYGDLELRCFDDCILESVYTSQKHSKNECDLTIFAEIESLAEVNKEVIFNFDSAEFKVNVDLAKGKNIVEFTFSINNPQLWYPAGYGEQILHPISVSIDDKKVVKKLG